MENAPSVAELVPSSSPRALNRALLARQMLLERAAMPVADAIEHLVAVQAQVPSDPYFALWSRLAGFDPEDLAALIAQRKAVRMTSLRGTVHLTSAQDARMLRPWTQPTITRLLASTPFGKNTRGVDREALVEVARAAVGKTPMTLAKLRPTLAEAFPGFSGNDLSYVFHYTTPLVQVPPRGLWRKSSAPKITTLEAWLGKPQRKPSPDTIVLRYLRAYGPASVADARAWSGVEQSRGGLRAPPAAARHVPRRARDRAVRSSRCAAPGSRYAGAAALPPGVRKRDPGVCQPRPDHRRRTEAARSRKTPGCGASCSTASSPASGRSPRTRKARR